MSNVKELVKQPGATFIDVRSPMEFQSAHVDGAINIPLEYLSGSIDQFKAFSKPLIVYCRSGNRSGLAVHILKASGVTEAYNGGGLDEMQNFLN